MKENEKKEDNSRMFGIFLIVILAVGLVLIGLKLAGVI